MAIGGGGLKGHSSTKSNNGGGGGGGGRVVMRSYVVVVLLVFGAAIFGVMLLHKIRERRIFNLVLKEKDHQLNSLRLHLQREREYAKEARRTSEDMKAKLYSLRTQKAELNGRVLEMQSIISSLKEEHKAMELALEEKQFEREKQEDASKENRNATALPLVWKQKDAETEDSNHNLDSPVKVWSVSMDDPSNPVATITSNVGIEQRDETSIRENKEDSGRINEQAIRSKDEIDLMKDADGSGHGSIINGNGENATHGNESETRVRVANRKETSGEEQSKKQKIAHQGEGNINRSDDKDQGISDGIFQDIDRSLETEMHKYYANLMEGIVDSGVEIEKTREGDGNVKVIENKEFDSSSMKQFGDNPELEMNYEGTSKLEMPANPGSGTEHRARENRTIISRVNGEKWRRLTETK